ncbi:MAG: leucine-rich repeat domain-containing protein [Candidatus Hodarchaeales archaeon]|jgi:Leucine-rich repeat (LRR) protein
MDRSLKPSVPSIKRLDISGCNITSLPDNIGNLSNLQLLFARQNQINMIPSTIKGLNYVKKISLIHNNLTSLPDTIGDLSDLVYLYLSHNKLKSLLYYYW